MYVRMRHYLKEEEFVDEFYDWAAAVATAVAGQWRPNDSCNDAARERAAYFFKSGEMTWLTFSSASVHRPPGGDAYSQVVLHSSDRVVTVWVSSPEKEPITKILLDRRMRSFLCVSR